MGHEMYRAAIIMVVLRGVFHTPPAHPRLEHLVATMLAEGENASGYLSPAARPVSDSSSTWNGDWLDVAFHRESLGAACSGVAYRPIRSSRVRLPISNATLACSSSSGVSGKGLPAHG